MGIEITEKSRETRVKQASMLNTEISLFGLNGHGRRLPRSSHGFLLLSPSFQTHLCNSFKQAVGPGVLQTFLNVYLSLVQYFSFKLIGIVVYK